MLSYIWVRVRVAISSDARFWVSGMAAERCGQLFRDDALTVNVTGSFIAGLFAALTDSEGRWLVSPSLREVFIIGVSGVRSHWRKPE
jgi:fluoride exporter